MMYSMQNEILRDIAYLICLYYMENKIDSIFCPDYFWIETDSWLQLLHAKEAKNYF